MNDYYKDQLRKLIIKSKRAIDNCETKEEINKIVSDLENELINFRNNVL